MSEFGFRVWHHDAVGRRVHVPEERHVPDAHNIEPDPGFAF